MSWVNKKLFIRAFCVAITVAALWWSSSSFGLGLGLSDIKIDSTLASPFRGSIELRGLSEIDLDQEQFSVTIESNANAAIEYRLERTGADSAKLILFSRASVTEPLFQFRVEVKWDRSVAARSYDVIIDPPAYASNPVMKKLLATGMPSDSRQALESIDEPAAEISQTLEGIDEPVAENPAEAAPEPIARGDEVDTVSAVIDPAFSKWLSSTENTSTVDGLEQRRVYGPTVDGNSIWRVARAVATDNPELNIYQWMYSIWKSNPSAFYRSNMHRLNMGEVLKIPHEREVSEVTRSEAWRIYNDQKTMLAEVLRTPDSVVGDMVPAETETAAALPGIELAGDEATTESDGGHGLPAETVETSKLAETTADDSVGIPEDSTASLAGGDLTEEESSSTVVTLTEQIEREEASIVIGTPAGDEVGATLEPMQGVQVRVEPESIAIIEAAPTLLGSDGNAPRLNEVDESASGWRNSLHARQQLIAQLPLIGADAPLAAVGRAIQWTDEYIATRPSWASMAFGVWVTIVIVMLSKQIRARRRFAAAVSQVASHPGVRLSPTPVMAPVPESAKPVPVDLRAQNAPVKLPNNAAAKKPTRKIEIDFNADEILSKADVFMQGKNSSEAVKLLKLAIKLQPDQLSFVVRLLEIYHKLKHDIAFELLLERFRPTLSELECSEQVHLQVMYGRLCPQATPLIDSELAADFLEEEKAAQAQNEPELDLDLGDDDEDYISTEVLVMNNGVLLDDNSRASAGMVGEVTDLEDTLNEIDVYLAYGLYDNAEELVLKGLEVDPNRVDFLIKLLDTYYATKNLVDFVTCAETLRDMGDEVNCEYWDKVESMGYELAPYNELFAAGKNKNLVGVELEFAKPESADLDIGSGDDDNLPAADLNVAEPAADSGLLSADDDADAVDEDFNLELDIDEAEDLSQDEVADDGNQHSLAKLDSADDLVAKILADHQDDDTTNINFDDWKTRNITIEEDEPILKGQVDDGDEDEDDDEPLTFDPIVDDTGEADEDEVVESDEYTELDLDQVAVNLMSSDTDTEPEDTMRFTIADESKLEAARDGVDNGSMDDAPGANTALDLNSDTGSGGILFFPNQSSDRESNREFESEVRTTLQSIRDQLQYMTERLYRQERETIDLRETLTDLRNQDDASRRKGNKKSR